MIKKVPYSISLTGRCLAVLALSAIFAGTLHAEVSPNHPAPAEHMLYVGDLQLFEPEESGSSSQPFGSTFTDDEPFSGQSNATPPPVPEEVPLPGLLWLILAGTGAGVYALKDAPEREQKA